MNEIRRAFVLFFPASSPEAQTPSHIRHDSIDGITISCCLEHPQLWLCHQSLCCAKVASEFAFTVVGGREPSPDTFQVLLHCHHLEHPTTTSGKSTDVVVHINGWTPEERMTIAVLRRAVVASQPAQIFAQLFALVRCFDYARLGSI